jgi:hypothetical protein
MADLKENLIRAAFPRGGDAAFNLLGGDVVIKDFREEETFEFKSLKERWKAKKDKKKEDLQTLKLKALSEKFDAPKRVEIKELELALRKLVEFKELGDSKKR